MNRRQKYEQKTKDLPPLNRAIRWFLAGAASLSLTGYADLPFGILVGRSPATAGYVAELFYPETIVPLYPDLENIALEGAAINSSGWGLIVGKENRTTCYAAFVSPTGSLSALSLPAGSLTGVSLNESGKGLISGYSGSGGYAAFVRSDGTVSSLDVSAATIIVDRCSLNTGGVGLLGGESAGDETPYAAYVAPDGTVTRVLNTPTDLGHIQGVAINDSDTGLICGLLSDGMNVRSYAAFVTPGGSSPLTLTPLPGTNSVLSRAALNASGVGLIGGLNESEHAYAGYVASDGTITQTLVSPSTGSIYDVAINDAGVGIVGGQNGSTIYAALVQPGVGFTPLSLDPLNGHLNAVAINQAGVGIIAGEISSSYGYAALIAPNGTITSLDVSGTGAIYDVALTEIIHSATPQSIGSYASAIYTQLAAASALETHFLQHNRFGNTRPPLLSHALQTADHSAEIACNEWKEGQLTALNSRRSRAKEAESLSSPKRNGIWLSPFGDFIYGKAQGTNPSYQNKMGGFLLGYDRQDSHYLVGTSFGYAFNSIEYAQKFGHGNVQEELGCLYGAYYHDFFWLSAALWVGGYQTSTTRHTLSFLSSKGKTHGWILSPHFELASPWAMDAKARYYAEPFFLLDWVSNWQKGFTETGASGLNLRMPSHYSSLLQSEIGIRFYERFVFGWGDFCLEEKLSYVNQSPFHFHSVTTSFIGSASSFPVAIGNSEIQNLGSAQLMGSFFPKNRSYPYGGFSFQTTANPSFQSYFVNAFTGLDF